MGKILIGGDFAAYNEMARPAAARLNADGSLDSTFAPGFAVGGAVFAFSCRSDGKIWIGGGMENSSGARRGLQLLNKDGSSDDSFVLGTSFPGFVLTLLPQADGKLLVGYSPASSSGEFSEGIMRLGADGLPDPTFTPATAAETGSVDAIRLLMDGRILLAGRMAIDGQSTHARVIRLTNSGVLDAILQPAPDAFESSRGFAVVALPDSSVLAGLHFGDDWAGETTQLWRFTPDDERDLAFTQISRQFASVNAIVEAGDGKWAVGGDFTLVDGVSQGGIALLNQDGTRDPDFDAGTGFDGPVESIAIDITGRLVIGGDSIT